jgi:hypothetical protein
MKNVAVLFILVLCVILAQGQEIMLNSTLVSDAGINPVINTINISKWRLGETHTIVLPNNTDNIISEQEWDVRSFPNPFKNHLILDFKIQEKTELSIMVTDITGENILLEDDKIFFNHERVSFNLSHLSSAMYLVSVHTKNKKVLKTIKVQKL